MKETAELAAEKNVRPHTHLSETEDENSFCEEMYGCRPLDYLEEQGWLTDRTWLAHGIHFTPEEHLRLGKAGTGIAHCPSSNFILASGACNVVDLEAAGVPVGLAVDGSASQDNSNLMQEVRQAFFVQRAQYGPLKVTHKDAIRWATIGSANVLGRADIGRIEIGAQADLALFKLDELRFSGAGDPLAALVICGAHKADYVMVAGDWRVKAGDIPGLDIAGLMVAHQAAAMKLQGL
jgi:8-oxoguanine deaminase